MIIVFYDQNADKIYICKPNERTLIADADDPNLMNYIPNDDIMYVTDGHFFTKQQFADYLSGESETTIASTDNAGPNRFDGFLNTNIGHSSKHTTPQHPATPSKVANRLYIHPTTNGTILMEDIDTPKFPGGIILRGRWHFIPVDEIGAETLDKSASYKHLSKIGKVEVVDEEYVKQHAHKKKSNKSPSEMALDRILVPSSVPGTADQVAMSGGLQSAVDDNVAIEINIEG